MKSLKEFLTENLENPTTTVQENTEEQLDENTTEETAEENAGTEKVV